MNIAPEIPPALSRPLIPASPAQVRFDVLAACLAFMNASAENVTIPDTMLVGDDHENWITIRHRLADIVQDADLAIASPQPPLIDMAAVHTLLDDQTQTPGRRLQLIKELLGHDSPGGPSRFVTVHRIGEEHPSLVDMGNDPQDAAIQYAERVGATEELIKMRERLEKAYGVIADLLEHRGA